MAAQVGFVGDELFARPLGESVSAEALARAGDTDDEADRLVCLSFAKSHADAIVLHHGPDKNR
jgi:hypothetical protein